MTGVAIRPTPEELAERLDCGPFLLSDLARYGYVIAHTDDVPEVPPDHLAHMSATASAWQEVGWRQCRTLIFGRDQ